MKDILEYIQSGILEMYVLGIATPEQTLEVEKMAKEHKEIRDELDKINDNIELYAQLHAVTPNPLIKPMLMATIDFTERLKKGEAMSFPPHLHKDSKLQDYSEWLSRPDMVPPNELKEIFAKIIGYTPQATTAIVWITEMAAAEVHDDEHEKFLIIEGECDFTVGEDVYHLVPGNVFEIPLHVSHSLKVTSKIPCKVILQRIAA
jgi:mannose-6-phosphate isomerase-like protein (cupin superfamily)